MVHGMLQVSMIGSFKHRGLKNLYQKGDRRGIRPDLAKKLSLYLSILDTAEQIEELDITGFHFHALKGDKRGLYSVYISRNHRLVFRFENSEAHDVNLVDYH